MKRPFGVLAEKSTADLALLLLEPVRSAEPATNSGIAGTIASIVDSDDLRVAIFCGVSSNAFLWALNAFARAAGRSCRKRRSNSARLRADSVAKRASHSVRAAAPRAPASRQLFNASDGTENGSSEMPSFSLAPLSSSAPSASPCTLAVPALVGAPKPIVVLQAIIEGLLDFCARVIAAAMAC